MFLLSPALVPALALALAPGCAEPVPPGATALVLTDAENYAYSAALTVDTVDAAAGTDVVVDWSALTRDLRGRPLDPADVDLARLLAFSIDKEDVLASINDNSLSQSDIRDIRELEPAGASSAPLSAFSFFGNAFDPAADFVPRDGTWTWAVTLWEEADGRTDILASVFLDPVDGGATEVLVTDETGDLDFAADLRSSAPLRAVADTPDISLDWSGLAHEASGQPFEPLVGDRLFIGQIADAASVAEVEAAFLTAFDDADVLYRMDVYGETAADLSQAVERDTGAAFPGFTTEGVWLLGIECTTCTSPAPVALAVVEAVPEE